MEHGRKEGEDDARENGHGPNGHSYVACTHERVGKGKPDSWQCTLGKSCTREWKKGNGVLSQIAL